jgi:GNAT superfamily N-acetyltransferase
MDSAGAVLLVATAHGRIVGSVIGGWDGWRGNIYRLAVVPEYRRLGIARRLVKEVSRALSTKAQNGLEPWWNTNIRGPFSFGSLYATSATDLIRNSSDTSPIARTIRRLVNPLIGSNLFSVFF